MKNSPSRLTIGSTKKAESQLQRRDRQTTLWEFMCKDAANKIDSLTQLHGHESVIRP